MELFYTIASQANIAQSKPELSLGGFVSSSKVPNGTFDNLFGEVSPYTLQNPKEQYIGLILKNTLRPVVSISMWMEIPNESICKYKIAPVALSEDGQMELVPSINSRPLYAEFVETSGDNKLVLDLEETFEVGGMLGLWVERSIDVNSDQVKNRNSCDFLYSMFKRGTKFFTQEEVVLKIDFNYGS